MPVLLLKFKDQVIPLSLSKEATFYDLESAVKKATKLSCVVVRRHDKCLWAKYNTRLADLHLRKQISVRACEGKSLTIYLRRAVDVLSDVYKCHPSLTSNEGFTWSMIYDPRRDTISTVKHRIRATTNIPLPALWLTNKSGVTMDNTALAGTHGTYILLPSNPDALLLNVTPPKRGRKESSIFVDKKDNVKLLLEKLVQSSDDPACWLSATCNGVKLSPAASWEDQGVVAKASVVVSRNIPKLNLEITVAGLPITNDKMELEVDDCLPSTIFELVESHIRSFRRAPGCDYALFFCDGTGANALPSSEFLVDSIQHLTGSPIAAGTVIPLLLHRRVKLRVYPKETKQVMIDVHPDLPMAEVRELLMKRGCTAASLLKLYLHGESTSCVEFGSGTVSLGIANELTLTWNPKPGHEMEMHIYVKTLAGRKIRFVVDVDEAIEDLKAKIQQEEGVAPDRQILLFSSSLVNIHLKDGRALSDYNIQPNTTLHLVLRLQGGMWTEFAGRVDYTVQPPPGFQPSATAAVVGTTTTGAKDDHVELEELGSDFDGGDSESDFE